jgi:hypothetical protein
MAVLVSGCHDRACRDHRCSTLRSHAWTSKCSQFFQSIVISYWDHNENHKAIYITVMLIGIILVNLAGVKYFGEFEFGASNPSFLRTPIVYCLF